MVGVKPVVRLAMFCGTLGITEIWAAGNYNLSPDAFATGLRQQAPIICPAVVLGSSSAGLIPQGQLCLSANIALLRRLTEPRDSFGIVLPDAVPSAVAHSQSVLGRRIAFKRVLSEIFGAGAHVLSALRTRFRRGRHGVRNDSRNSLLDPGLTQPNRDH